LEGLKEKGSTVLSFWGLGPYEISEMDVFFIVPLHHCQQPNTFFNEELQIWCFAGAWKFQDLFFGRVEVIE